MSVCYENCTIDTANSRYKKKFKKVMYINLYDDEGGNVSRIGNDEIDKDGRSSVVESNTSITEYGRNESSLWETSASNR